MPILAMDTATMVSSVAVADNKKLLAELTVQTRLTHSETLMPHIQHVLEMASVKREQLEAVAVSIGPGSFTGLRIGLAAAKGIAYALNIPLIGIPTAEALAWHFPVPGSVIVPIIDAQKGNVYAAAYEWQNKDLVELEPIGVYSLQEALAKWGATDRQVIFVGDMAFKKLYGRDALPANAIVPPVHTIMPRAANVAMAGLAHLSKGQVGNVMDMEPIYIRRSEAEELWEKRQAALKQEQIKQEQIKQEQAKQEGLKAESCKQEAAGQTYDRAKGAEQ